MRNWQHLQGKRVLVKAAGTEYRGVVLEMGERSLLLRAVTGHREIPWERVTAIQEEAGQGSPGRRSILG